MVPLKQLLSPSTLGIPQDTPYDASTLKAIEKNLSDSSALARTVLPSARLMHCMELGHSVLVSYHLRSRHLQARELATPENACSKAGKNVSPRDFQWRDTF